MREINIDWTGPYTYKEVINEKENKYGSNSVKPKDKGLYQIYGSHPIYGDNVLIYIGKTIQPFYKRLKERGIILNNHDANNIQVYLGSIVYDGTKVKENINDDINDAESLLIHYHKPSHNSSNINTFKVKSTKDFIVNNTGFFRQLSPIISTKYFNDFEIFAYIQNLADELNINKIYEEDDGFGFYITDDIWFGVEYNLWINETVLVLMSTNNNIFKDNYKIKKYAEDNIWFYESINGKENKIKSLLLKLQKKYNDKNRHK